jgi:hypothetical protein
LEALPDLHILYVCYILIYVIIYNFAGSINFLTADGEKFSHPLHHLGKTSKDLPILAIDSFRHMYIWKQNPKTDLE